MIPETIHWHPVDAELPDADSTVLIHHPEWPDEPVIKGYFDGEHWRDEDNFTLDGAGGFIAPTHWADLPGGPCKPVS